MVDRFTERWLLDRNRHRDTKGFARMNGLIQAFYSTDEDAVFLVMNGIGDMTHLQKVFLNNPEKNFFEKLRESENSQARLFHFICIVSHLIIFVESTTRFDLSLPRSLKAVNKIRLFSREDISSLLEDELTSGTKTGVSDWVREGRIACPRLIFAFHRNVIRHELGAVKKREIYEKLEQSLESQIYSVLKCYKLIDNGTGASLGYISENDPFVHLINPSVVNSNPLADILNISMGEIEPDDDRRVRPISSFTKFLRQNMDSVRADKIRVYQHPTLSTFIHGTRLISTTLDEKSDIVTEKILSKYINRELQFMENLTDTHINFAIEQYSWSGYGKDRERNVFTKAEHDQHFANAVSFLDSVLVGSRDSAMSRLRTACESLWQGGMRGCEQQSLTGNNCQLKMHSSIGDASVASSKWEMHTNSVTYLSTCTCGRSQTIRKDPFSLKEANYDFYYLNPNFNCCKGLERHVFTILEDDGSEIEKEKIEFLFSLLSEWSANDDWVGPVAAASNPVFTRKRIKASTGERMDDPHSDEDEELEVTDSETDDERREGSARSGFIRITFIIFSVKDPHDIIKEASVEFEERQKKLRLKKIPFLEGVPHSLSPALPPLFPSWSLTCIGPSSIYSHSLGLRDQPNFKIGCEYLLPVDLHLQVKLFVGFDYECPRGHRFFVGDDGEPLLLPKIPSQEGRFFTGEPPLELSWARYYILQLPFVYSGPSGVWIPPTGLERVGSFKGNAIQVKYAPLSIW
uniref:Nonsense-mediated mRNA decay factor SMG8 n=1 Tax=Heterorhabditis bacteriophora TaxID=37862 RepID=A0A1I7XEJ3_HETBA